MKIFKNIDFHAFVESLVRTIEIKDIYTAGHSKRVSELSELICVELSMSPEECEYMHIAGHLHDIGKIGIPDGILLKSGRLTDPEYLLVQQHSIVGASIFENLKDFVKMSGIIRHHHERYDGLGYPDRLKGKDIPAGSAIISIADSFDAMTTSRSYRPCISPAEALEEIIGNSGKQFDPEIVEAFSVVFKNNKDKIDSIINNHQPADRRRLYRSFCSIKTDIQKKDLTNNIR